MFEKDDAKHILFLVVNEKHRSSNDYVWCNTCWFRRTEGSYANDTRHSIFPDKHLSFFLCSFKRRCIFPEKAHHFFSEKCSYFLRQTHVPDRCCRQSNNTGWQIWLSKITCFALFFWSLFKAVCLLLYLIDSLYLFHPLHTVFKLTPSLNCFTQNLSNKSCNSIASTYVLKVQLDQMS